MKFELLQHTSDSKKLILIFTGWSTGPELYKELKYEGWDLAVVHDYSDMQFDSSVLNKYTTIWLFAWSLGIKAAAAALPVGKITAAYAINGTMNPVDDEEGIPTAVYEGTMNNLDPRNLMKFRRRMSPDAETYRKHFDCEFTSDDIESLRSQLNILRNIKEDGALIWRKAFISDSDRIFPPENMLNSWVKNGVEIVNLNGAHYYPIDVIIRNVLPMPERIAGKFHSAQLSYDRHAVAQDIIASHLCTLLTENLDNHPDTVLEIGPFTGLLTRKYSQILHPESIDFVDICPVSKFNVAQHEEYFCADAEQWLENTDKTYDLILSSSTIQWFSNISQFIKNCKRCLKPNGIIAISSFTAGNLKELDTFRPAPLHYPTVNQYKEWIETEFSDFTIETSELPIKFMDKRELLMHLKHTGVNAGGNLSHSPLSLPDSLTTLTYCPIYIIARN